MGSTREGQHDRKRPRRQRSIVRWILLALLLVTVSWIVVSGSFWAQGLRELAGSQPDEVVLHTKVPFVLAAHRFRYYKFALPEASKRMAILGQLNVSNPNVKDAERKENDNALGGEGNQIEVYVLGEPAFAAWQNGEAARYVFDSGRVSRATISADLPPGPRVYYLVFSNRSSAQTVNVTATILLHHKSWMPRWAQ